MQSSACSSGHTIQHREKPFIQQSRPTPPSKLPSNSVRPEWTRWHSSAAPPIPSHPPCRSQPRQCLFFTASSSFFPKQPYFSISSLLPASCSFFFVVPVTLCNLMPAYILLCKGARPSLYFTISTTKSGMY